MERSADRCGQASAEYVALIALVAIALVAAAGLTSGGVGARVLAGMQRALCAVVGRDCPRPTPVEADLPPCPLERSSRVELLSGVLDVVKLGAGGTLNAVRTSDGRITVTLADDAKAGAEVGAGARLRFGDGALDGSVRAGLVATWTSGRSWTLPNAAAARAFVARYGDKATVGGRIVDELRGRCSLLCDAVGWRPHPQLPPPDTTYEEDGTLATLTAKLGLGEPASASAGGSTAKVLGRRLARDGTTTWYVRLVNDVKADLDLGPATLGRDLGETTVASYTLDPSGRPTTFVLHSVRATGAHAALSTSGAAQVHAGADAGRLEEEDEILDLRDPANRAAAASLLAGFADEEQLHARIVHFVALMQRIAQQGEVDRRVYALARSSNGLGATVALGAELSADFDRTTEGMRLLDAQTRLPGLPFLPRDDCRRVPS